jgi:hypothetical protein
MGIDRLIEDLSMHDLIIALKTIEESALPINRNLDLNKSKLFKQKVTGAVVLLGRIDELACEDLLYQYGEREGFPDQYSIQSVRDAGFVVRTRGSMAAGNFTGVIETSKGSVHFG